MTERTGKKVVEITNQIAALELNCLEAYRAKATSDTSGTNVDGKTVADLLLATGSAFCADFKARLDAYTSASARDDSITIAGNHLAAFSKHQIDGVISA